MQKLQSSRIAFIGGGNMATAIIRGLLTAKINPKHITVSEPWDVARSKLDALGVTTLTSNVDAAADADLVVLAIKPQVMATVCVELASAWKSRDKLPTILSIAAGITLANMTTSLQSSDSRVPHVVRAMPNTPALVGEGAVGVYASSEVTEEEKSLVSELLESISGATEWVSSEGLLDVVTGLSGSGPAYFFQMVEHLVVSAIALGLPEDQAIRLATQTCLGAGRMLKESADGPEQLRKNVTSPNGTTHAALVTFDKLGFKNVVEKSVKAAVDRSIELGKD